MYEILNDPYMGTAIVILGIIVLGPWFAIKGWQAGNVNIDKPLIKRGWAPGKKHPINNPFKECG